MVCFTKYDPLIPASVTSDELVFLQPVEYNSYFAGACISWRRDANGGAWQPHYRITDHLGSTRLETSSNGTITAAYDYKPFGEQIPLMTTKTRKTYIGKERDDESYLGDFGVRKYDYAAGRFTSPDVLWEKYMGWSPYIYSANNPISLLDPSGYEYYVNNCGYLFKAEPQNPKDPTVYMLNGSEKNSALKNIGELGGTVDATEIITNLTNKNSNLAKNMDVFEFVSSVKTGGVFDFKSDQNSIFGNKQFSEASTSFTFEKRGIFSGKLLMKGEDVGNFHFGVIGLANGIFSAKQLAIGAGVYQIYSKTSKPKWLFPGGILNSPHGDDPRDQSFMKLGFKYYNTVNP